ncbi:helix-turn-helix transcriptional regulator [Coleofasciculus sp. FACHB-1120]|uniref:helix-turn-helix transcriptional regulator n=1 Tax=Coleofasciculus sp. FACHB-1120 TaxID=2692783 RepID=UPI001686B4D3|nr:helix-turn-helix transcriptional regulator [Coleofasciculus sp. FACHB-1120]MBD2743224.1 helix-turn-helix transcriptional regulator [Coleofasciculus sp. FACHB-1120]
MTEKLELEQESPLKKRREELNLTQRDVAVAVDVSVQTVSNWETGRYQEARLTLPQVKALCRILQWSINDLPNDLGPLDKSS